MTEPAAVDALFAQLAREPVPGRVKTRLQPALSAGAAARLHSEMVRSVCQTLCASGRAQVQLWVDGDRSDPLFAGLEDLGLDGVFCQRGRDLGERMRHIAERGFLQGYRKVVLVGSDAPSLSEIYLGAALDSLDESDVVFGPALDGGYVLLGLRRPVAALFQDIPWGSDQVLAVSEQRCRSAGMRYELLEALPDIDRPEDLHHLPDSLAHCVPPSILLRRK